MTIYNNEYFYIQIHESEIPWLKIFSNKKYKEFSDCDDDTRKAMLDAMLTVEKKMIEYFNPDKVNIAMFGNYLPHLHIHVMARFLEDSHFPEPMWGERQRDSKLDLPPMDEFVHIIKNSLR